MRILFRTRTIYDTGKPSQTGWAFVLFVSQIFALCGHSTPDMPLGLVFVQNLPHLDVKVAVILRQPLGKIFMYRGFGDSEMFGSRPYSGASFNHVHSQFAGSLLNRICHSLPSDAVCYQKNLCEAESEYASLTQWQEQGKIVLCKSTESAPRTGMERIRFSDNWKKAGFVHGIAKSGCYHDDGKGREA